MTNDKQLLRNSSPKKRTQIELLEEISNKLSVVIDQLNNVLNYEPNVVELDTPTEDNSTEVVDNNRGDYSSVFGTISEDDLNHERLI